MMKLWLNIFRVLILIIGIIALAFDALLYNFCEKQKSELSAWSDRQKLESQVNGNKFKFQQDQIDRLSKDLEDAQQQINDQNGSLADQKDALAAQKEAFLGEVEKRQEIENENKTIQSSLVDIKAESDAIKHDMKVWQKDYAAVLAQLAKKMDDIQSEIAPSQQPKDKNENQT